MIVRIISLFALFNAVAAPTSVHKGRSHFKRLVSLSTSILDKEKPSVSPTKKKKSSKDLSSKTDKKRDTKDVKKSANKEDRADKISSKEKQARDSVCIADGDDACDDLKRIANAPIKEGSDASSLAKPVAERKREARKSSESNDGQENYKPSDQD